VGKKYFGIERRKIERSQLIFPLMIANLVSMEMDLDVEFSGDSPPLPTPLNVTQALWDLAMLATSTTQWPLLQDTGSGTPSSFSSSFSAENFSELAVTETPYVPYGRRPETYIVPILFALIFVVGVLGNGTLIVVFLSVRQMRNVPNT